jgi:hypothetical protein
LKSLTSSVGRITAVGFLICQETNGQSECFRGQNKN